MKNILKPIFAVLIISLMVTACDKKSGTEKHPVEIVSDGEPMTISVDGKTSDDVEMWLE